MSIRIPPALIVMGAASLGLLAAASIASSVKYAQSTDSDTLVQVRRVDEDAIVLDADIGRGKQPVGRFTIANSTSQQVEVKFQGRSCSCTSVRVNGQPAQPSQSWQVMKGQSLLLEMEAPFAAQASGHRALRTEFVARQGGKEVPFSASWEVNVLAALAVNPTPVQLRIPAEAAVDQRESESQFQVVRRCWSGGDKNRTLETPAITQLPEGVEIASVKHLRRNVEDNGLIEETWSIQLKLKNPDQLADAAGNTLTALVKTSDPDGYPIERVWSLLVLRPSGIIAPKMIDLGSINSGQQAHRRILLLTWDRSAFHVTEARSNDSSIKVTTSDGGTPHRVWLEVAGAASEACRVETELIIHTDHAVDRVLRIPCRILVQDASPPNSTQMNTSSTSN